MPRLPKMPGKEPHACITPESAHLTRIDDRLWAQDIEFADREQAWSLPFEAPEAAGK